MEKINFQDGTRISRAKVTIDGVDHIVTPAEFSGATPLSAYVMNRLQTNVENSINQNADNIGGEEYDDTKTYDVGDIVKFGGRLYICQTTISTPEEFNPINWEETDVLSSAGGNEIAIGSSSDITGKTKIYVEEATQRLKYKDPTTGNFKEIRIRATDELPVGSEIDIDDNSEIPVGWEEIETEYTLTITTSGENSYKAFKVGNVATITGRIVSATVSTGRTAVGSVPDELKPTEERQVPAIFMDASSGAIFGYGTFYLKTDGTMQVVCNTSHSTKCLCFLNISYPTN